MTPAELAKIGWNLYGPAWKPKMASQLGRSRSTVWNWMNGKARIPETAAARIRQLEKEHDAR